MSDRSESEDPQFETDSVDDLAELLGRAANWAERDCGADVIAAEHVVMRVAGVLGGREVPPDRFVHLNCNHTGPYAYNSINRGIL